MDKQTLTSRLGGRENKHYPHYHDGPALIVARAWCMERDLAAALAMFPDATIFAANSVARHVKAAHIVSVHDTYMHEHRIGQIKRFKNTPICHAVAPRTNHVSDAVDYWWPQFFAPPHASWIGVKIAHVIGHAPIVLCGCPLVIGPYHGGAGGVGAFDRTESAKGVEKLRALLLEDADWHPFVTSMSGWTQEVFGAPAPPKPQPKRRRLIARGR